VSPWSLTIRRPVKRSITIWAAISTVLLAGVLSAIYLLSLGLGGSDPVDKPGTSGFWDGALALLVAILPGLIGTLIAFFVASRVERLSLSATDKIAAEVEERLTNTGRTRRVSPAAFKTSSASSTRHWVLDRAARICGIAFTTVSCRRRNRLTPATCSTPANTTRGACGSPVYGRQVGALT
jgi:hypothetical protein